jgi:ubiquinone/menaquinone biosynthesis C-methylase UbiE
MVEVAGTPDPMTALVGALKRQLGEEARAFLDLAEQDGLRFRVHALGLDLLVASEGEELVLEVRQPPADDARAWRLGACSLRPRAVRGKLTDIRAPRLRVLLSELKRRSDEGHMEPGALLEATAALRAPAELHGHVTEPGQAEAESTTPRAADLEAPSETAWGGALSTATQILTSSVGCDSHVFGPLIDFATRRGPSPDGALTVEWVAAPESGRCGVTVFEHGPNREHLDAARAICAALFDPAAVDAWDAVASQVSGLDIEQHVGLAWDQRRGFRLKLFLSGHVGLGAAARVLGLAPGPGLVGVGCDFWVGGRYRPRRYFNANDFESLLAHLGAGANLPSGLMPIPPGGHAVLTLTEANDEFGAKTTWTVIFPPGLPLDTVVQRASEGAKRGLAEVAARVAPFGLSPSALELDIYDDGREETELLVTLGARVPRPRGRAPRAHSADAGALSSRMADAPVSDQALLYMDPLLGHVERTLDAGQTPPRHLHLGFWERPPAHVDEASVRTAQDAMTRRLLEVARVQPGEQVVDVGCGIGGTLLDLAERVPNLELVGVNRCQRQLAVARRLALEQGHAPPALTFVFGDAGALPSSDASVDRVLALECAFHFDSRRAFLREAARVLRPGGRLAMTDFVPTHGATVSPTRHAALLAGHSPWPDLLFAEGDYKSLGAAVGLHLDTWVDATENVMPTLAQLVVRVRDNEASLATLAPVDRATAALGLMLADGTLRLRLVGFERGAHGDPR